MDSYLKEILELQREREMERIRIEVLKIDTSMKKRSAQNTSMNLDR